MRSTVIDVRFLPPQEFQYTRNQLACLETRQGHEPALGHGANHAARGKPVDAVAVLPMQ
jgi:hypothetical protein